MWTSFSSQSDDVNEMDWVCVSTRIGEHERSRTRYFCTDHQRPDTSMAILYTMGKNVWWMVASGGIAYILYIKTGSKWNNEILNSTYVNQRLTLIDNRRKEMWEKTTWEGTFDDLSARHHKVFHRNAQLTPPPAGSKTDITPLGSNFHLASVSFRLVDTVPALSNSFNCLNDFLFQLAANTPRALSPPVPS